MVLQTLSGFSLKLTVFQENKQGNTIPYQKNIVAWSSAYKKLNNFVTLIQRIPVGTVLQMVVPQITKNYMKNIHQASKFFQTG